MMIIMKLMIVLSSDIAECFRLVSLSVSMCLSVCPLVRPFLSQSTWSWSISSTLYFVMVLNEWRVIETTSSSISCVSSKRQKKNKTSKSKYLKMKCKVVMMKLLRRKLFSLYFPMYIFTYYVVMLKTRNSSLWRYNTKNMHIFHLIVQKITFDRTKCFFMDYTTFWKTVIMN